MTSETAAVLLACLASAGLFLSIDLLVRLEFAKRRVTKLEKELEDTRKWTEKMFDESSARQIQSSKDLNSLSIRLDEMSTKVANIQIRVR